MSYRFMRMIVFFDLPTETHEDKREYTHFRKFLIKSGFMMMQQSVYCKLTLNQNTAAALMEQIRKHRPPKGLVQALLITEKQYSRMEFIVGNSESDIISEDSRCSEV